MKGNRAVGVRLEDGKEAFAKTIISDAGIRNTYGKLLPGGDTQEAWLCQEAR